MLVEFRVRNYRSIREETVLSFAASPDKAHLDTNTHGTQATGLPAILRAAVIYGANASGKTTLVQALALMRGLVVESTTLQPNQLINVQPFALDVSSSTAPTSFEVTVALGEVRYQYGFEFTSLRIVNEWLLVYRNAKPQMWFDRRSDDAGKQTFQFGSHLTGYKRMWQEATRSNALFLSTAIQLNSEKLRPLYDWFSTSLQVFMDGGQIPDQFTTNMIQAGQRSSQIVGLMSAADIAIESISTYSTKGFNQHFTLDMTTGQTTTKAEEVDMFRPRFRHVVGETSAEFELQDESQGTQKLFALSGPLLDILDRGSIMVVDELDRSLHPSLVRKIVETFQNAEINRNGAQLLFTTHDTSLLDQTLLRRDQIWFTEKQVDQSSTLTPLTDFSPRKGEALEQNYLAGRYGGVPILASALIERVSRAIQ